MSRSNTTTENWVSIGEYATLQEAAIVRGRLESAGIRAVIPEDVMSGSVYPMTLTWCGIDVLVPSSEATAAKALLSE